MSARKAGTRKRPTRRQPARGTVRVTVANRNFDVTPDRAELLAKHITQLAEGALREMAPPAIDHETFREACTTWDDEGLAVGTLNQCATELHVLLAAKQNGCADHLVDSALLGIATRMAAAAKVAHADDEAEMLERYPELRPHDFGVRKP